MKKVIHHVWTHAHTLTQVHCVRSISWMDATVLKVQSLMTSLTVDAFQLSIASAHFMEKSITLGKGEQVNVKSAYVILANGCARTFPALGYVLWKEEPIFQLLMAKYTPFMEDVSMFSVKTVNMVTTLCLLKWYPVRA